MPSALYFFVVATIVLAFWYAKSLALRRRGRALAALARSLGAQYAQNDPFYLPGSSFALFRRGSSRRASNVIWGLPEGGCIFDYRYREGSGKNSRTYQLSCAMTGIAAQCPHLTLGPEGFWSSIADHVGAQDVQFESEDFNRAFEVHCDDQRFAFAVVDGRMMEWLLQGSRGAQFEVLGPRVLCAVQQVAPDEVPLLLRQVEGFRTHVPSVVTSMYPIR